MPELDLIRYVTRLASESPESWLALGIGDDAAVVDLPQGTAVVLTVDSVVESVHFETGLPAREVGQKAVARGLSDIAAMAARALCTLAAVSFREGTDDAWCRDLIAALHATALELGAPLVGGDITSGPGPLSVVVTAIGTPGPGGVVTRAGARPGDLVCVTGTLGGSIKGRHLGFRPRIREALALAENYGPHALIDISDGLSTDALHVAEASDVSIVLDGPSVPVSEAARELASEAGRDALWHALNDGEDYELLFCIAAKQAHELAADGLAGTPVTVIGEVGQSGPSLLKLQDGSTRHLTAQGWEHLG